jgi:hypothetical protein
MAPSIRDSGFVPAIMPIQDGQSISSSNCRIGSIVLDCLNIRVVDESDRDMPPP